MESITRIEKYLEGIENGGDVPVPVTRIEHYLYEIAQGGGGASSADDVSYDNTASGLSATNVQAAIDELANSSGGGFIAQSTAPSDTSLLWIDTDDNTIDETLADGDTSAY